jgi:prevent-host-death family protein
MDEIPQRELRNNIAAVLRAAEAGAEYTVTVGGRPVARLGPYRARRWVDREDVVALLATPTDPTWLGDLGAPAVGGDLEADPWHEA